jgi:hypothetical protein
MYVYIQTYVKSTRIHCSWHSRWVGQTSRCHRRRFGHGFWACRDRICHATLVCVYACMYVPLLYIMCVQNYTKMFYVCVCMHVHTCIRVYAPVGTCVWAQTIETNMQAFIHRHTYTCTFVAARMHKWCLWRIRRHSIQNSRRIFMQVYARIDAIFCLCMYLYVRLWML